MDALVFSAASESSSNTRLGTKAVFPAVEQSVSTAESALRVEEALEVAQKRCNSTPEALGHLHRVKLPCGTLLFSPDHNSYFVTTFVTIIIVGVNCLISFKVASTCEFIFCMSFVVLAFTLSFIFTAVDPGVYPRLLKGEVDVLASIEGGRFVYCRTCGIFRPPLTSHCRICDVCVLNHDHHCTILGGCVGRRTLRFFVGYLVSISICLAIGVMWIVRRLISSTMPPDETEVSVNSSSLFPSLSGGTLTGSSLNTSIAETRRVVRNSRSDFDILFVPTAFLFVVDTVILLVVGSFTVMYVYFFFTKVTRRESQRGLYFRRTWRRCLNLSVVAQNIWSGCCPPPSLIPYTKGEDHRELL